MKGMTEKGDYSAFSYIFITNRGRKIPQTMTTVSVCKGHGVTYCASEFFQRLIWIISWVINKYYE